MSNIKNIFVVLLFLSFAFGFGQNNAAPKEDAKLIKENTTDVNKAVMAMTLDIATRSLANQLNSLSAGQRDVSRFESIYEGMNAKADKLKSELGYDSAPEAAQGTEFKSNSGNTYKLPY